MIFCFFRGDILSNIYNIGLYTPFLGYIHTVSFFWRDIHTVSVMVHIVFTPPSYMLSISFLFYGFDIEHF